jgi:hypothetical protein
VGSVGWGDNKVSTLDDTFGTSRGGKYLSRVKCKNPSSLKHTKASSVQAIKLPFMSEVNVQSGLQV